MLTVVQLREERDRLSQGTIELQPAREFRAPRDTQVAELTILVSLTITDSEVIIPVLVVASILLWFALGHFVGTYRWTTVARVSYYL